MRSVGAATVRGIVPGCTPTILGVILASDSIRLSRRRHRRALPRHATPVLRFLCCSCFLLPPAPAGAGRCRSPRRAVPAAVANRQREHVEPISEPAANPTFGSTFTSESGSAVTVGAPQPCVPSDTQVGAGRTRVLVPPGDGGQRQHSEPRTSVVQRGVERKRRGDAGVRQRAGHQRRPPADQPAARRSPPSSSCSESRTRPTWCWKSRPASSTTRRSSRLAEQLPRRAGTPGVWGVGWRGPRCPSVPAGADDGVVRSAGQAPGSSGRVWAMSMSRTRRWCRAARQSRASPPATSRR